MNKFNKVFASYKIRRLRFMSWITIYCNSDGECTQIGWSFTKRGAWKVADDHSLTLMYLRGENGK